MEVYLNLKQRAVNIVLFLVNLSAYIGNDYVVLDSLCYEVGDTIKIVK